MPAILDDPAAPTIYRVSGDPPYPDPANPAVPPGIVPRHVTLRDRQTAATVFPFASRHEVPESLLRYLNDQFNKEIEGGDTYPMLEPMPFDKFASYWFQNFAGIMLLGHIESAAEVVEGKDWAKDCLGTFYIKPNYPGRSSHVCNAGFIVTDAARNRGVGRLMGETYLDWAPKLGYKYSVFNLVYETNVASCKIWDALGFKRIGRVKGAGNLKSYPDRLVDAIIYGRDLGDAAGGPGSEELVSEERFDKIKFYLKHGRYPNGADRAEKSRLRSAATHYKLLDGDILMLKDKEVISDPQRQYEIARAVHNQAHGGINKTTSTIAERYHWSRIKETVSDVIKNCAECKDTSKASSPHVQQVPVNGLKRPNLSPASASASKRASPSPSAPAGPATELSTGAQRPPVSPLTGPSHLSPFTVPSQHQYADPSNISILTPPTHHALPSPTDTTMTGHDAIVQDAHNPMLQAASHGHLHPHHHHTPSTHAVSLPSLAPDPHSVPIPVYEPIDPQIINQPATSADLHHHYSFSHPSPSPHHHHTQAPTHHDPDTDAADAETFQALINAAGTDDDDDDDQNLRATATNDSSTAAHPLHHHSHNENNDDRQQQKEESHRHAQQAHADRASRIRQQQQGEEQGHREEDDDEGLAHTAVVDRDLDLEMLIESSQSQEDGRHDRDPGASLERGVASTEMQSARGPMDVDMEVGDDGGSVLKSGGGKLDVAHLLDYGVEGEMGDGPAR
ncbi:hypothetical protein C8A03DRAFT_18374 [Achaetomium macrosporum]|uniref:N-acetyltransferase domain-containing protein n=1 Tax=Achaetomium macrosporum TaxID=79813 RepID=A0AAN7C3Y9_9PEZI|nr:hypothetical protein C8A03DRAFT_18374 [Achaetomium macrosporum]